MFKIIAIFKLVIDFFEFQQVFFTGTQNILSYCLKEATTLTRGDNDDRRKICGKLLFLSSQTMISKDLSKKFFAVILHYKG